MTFRDLGGTSNYAKDLQGPRSNNFKSPRFRVSEIFVNSIQIDDTDLLTFKRLLGTADEAATGVMVQSEHGLFILWFALNLNRTGVVKPHLILAQIHNLANITSKNSISMSFVAHHDYITISRYSCSVAHCSIYPRSRIVSSATFRRFKDFYRVKSSSE